MRALSPPERWALSALFGPPATHNATTPEGANLDAAMGLLVERGCARIEIVPCTCCPRHARVTPTELGYIARRLAALDLA